MFTDWEAGHDPTPVTSEPSYPAIPTDYDPPTRTITVNMTQQSKIVDYSKYCPLTDEDYDGGYFFAEVPDNCEELFEKYCEPNLDEPKPTSTMFPRSCFPWRGSETPTPTQTEPKSTGTRPTTTNPAKPSPTMDGTNPDCTKYHKVESEDGCYDLAKENGITLDNVSLSISSKVCT